MNPRNIVRFFSVSLVLLLSLTGCQTPGNNGSTRDSNGQGNPAQNSLKTYGPASTTFERDGITYITGSVAYPTGVLSSSALLLEKVVPAEAMVGETYQLSYTLRNLLDIPLRDVVLTDVVGENFRLGDAAPAADYAEGGTATWFLGELPPGGTRNVIIKASSPGEGLVGTTSSVVFTPAYREQTRIVRGKLSLELEVLPAATPCDTITGRVTVTNSGTARLTSVSVQNRLPDGLQLADSQADLVLDAGNLQPEESRSFDLVLNATRQGKFQIRSEAVSAQGIDAADSATVLIRAPELSISGQAPSERFIGQALTVCMQIRNSGDAVSTSTVLNLPLPEGVSFQSATMGGIYSNGVVTWNLGSIPAGNTVEPCVTLTARNAGNLKLTGTVQGNCASPASTTTSTLFSGIPAIMLEVFDLKDPIQVGSDQTYQIVVTNQGSAPATNVRVTAQIEAEQSFISSTGTTRARASGQTIVMRVVPSIAPGDKASWQIAVRALAPGDIRFSVQMESDQVGRPVRETEATNQY